jgi:hypothetical protein
MNNFGTIMYKLNKSTKIWLFVLIVASIFWLGGINVRALIGNELLNYDEFSFRTNIPPDEENMVFKMVSYSSILIMISYLITFISAIFFVTSFKIKFKENGWFLMCVLLFFIFSPVEFYTSYLDIKFVLLFYQKPVNHDTLLKLFGERIGFLKGVPWIALLSYYAIIFIAVFKPLKRTPGELREEQNKKSENDYEYFMHEDDDIIHD